MARLQDPVSILKGVGPRRQKQLSQLGIYTLEDLICHFPRGYQDRTKIRQIRDLEVDEPACFHAMVMNTPRTHKIRKGLEVTKVKVADSSGSLNLTFFNQKYTTDQLQYGESYVFFGTLTGDGFGYQMVSPVFERIESAPVLTRRVMPVYPLTAGISNTVMANLVRQAMAICDAPAEVLPEEVLSRYGILPAERAYEAIHFPSSMEEAELARKRMVFEEFFVFSAGLALVRASRETVKIAPYKQVDLTPFYHGLPFALTGAQSRAIREISQDFQKGSPMNRLLQGDVGSGKTMVAAASAYLAFLNGQQTAIMAPTEILAKQHFATFSKVLKPLGLEIALLTGSTTAAQKRLIKENMAQGKVDLVVGTHALLTQDKEFASLGLVIADEQHRFGVAQRSALTKKADAPHVLVMSATPIPRTLALLMYGDLEVSVLDELPPGRQRVDTFLVNESYRARLNGFIRKQAEEGHQVYVVCPAVEEGEGLDLKAATLWAETLQQTVFPDLNVGLVHGQMKAQEKEQVMAAFSAGQIQVLVATTVIEVGVDVPNATLMVIEDADRFGLSQLHQLRGRVGRGKDKSWCILVSSNKNDQTLQRLKALCATTDGFQIAQEDLKMRGPGDFFGQRQSGLPVFRMASLGCDLNTLQLAQKASCTWIETSGTAQTPQARALRQRIATLFDRSEGTMN